MRHRSRCAVSRITRIRLFPLFFHNGCSQSSRFLPQARRIVGSGDEIATLRKCRDPSDPSANVIYCITCTLCKKLCIGETGRRLGDRFREHLRDVEKDDKNASKPVARHSNLPNHSKQHMAVCGLSPHRGSTESRKTLETKNYFSNEHFLSSRYQRTLFMQLIYCCFSRHQAPTNSVAPSICI